MSNKKIRVHNFSDTEAHTWHVASKSSFSESCTTALSSSRVKLKCTYPPVMCVFCRIDVRSASAAALETGEVQLLRFRLAKFNSRSVLERCNSAVTA